MATNSKIEWTHHTDNLWWGCTEVHAGCDNCYARVLSHRYDNGQPLWGANVPRKAVKSVWGAFLSQQVKAQQAGETHRVFVGSMMDIFEKPQPLIDHKGNPMEGTTDVLRQRFFEEVVPACPNLLFLLLSKRPSNIKKYIPDEWKRKPPPNVMFGTSPVDQATYNTLVPQLLEVDGWKFLSVEPQLGPITPNEEHATGLDWIIQGGESGQGKRPFSLFWASAMRKWCAANRVPYFFKQIDKVIPIPPAYFCQELPIPAMKLSSELTELH